MLVERGVQSTLNSLCDCGSAAKCVSQNSEAQVRAAHQVFQRRSTSEGFSAAQILIYVISSDKLLKWALRERPGDGRAQL